MVQRRHGRRSALAFVFYASAFGWCFVEQCKSGPCPLLRSWSGPVRAALGERRGGGSSFWAAVQNAASNNKTDAETYITEAKKRAGQHMSSSQLVDRDAAVHALIQSIEETGLLTVVLGARMWAKLANETVKEMATSKEFSAYAGPVSGIVSAAVSVMNGMGPASAVIGNLVQETVSIASKRNQVKSAIDAFLQMVNDATKRSAIVVDEANLALPGLTNGKDVEEMTEARSALAAITAWTKQDKQTSVVLISSEFAYPFRLQATGLDLRDIGRVIVIDEVPEPEMLKMLQKDWGMDEGLAKLFYEYFGGDIYTTKQALDMLIDKKDTFDPFAVVKCPGLPSCAKDPSARAHLENLAKHGFSLVEDVEADEGARMIAEKNIAHELANIPLPTPGVPSQPSATSAVWVCQLSKDGAPMVAKPKVGNKLEQTGNAFQVRGELANVDDLKEAIKKKAELSIVSFIMDIYSQKDGQWMKEDEDAQVNRGSSKFKLMSVLADRLLWLHDSISVRWRNLSESTGRLPKLFSFTSLLGSYTILEIGGPVHQGSLQHAEGVLAEAALDEFQQELPHWWQRLGDYFLRPVALLLPKRLRSSPWSFPFFRATEKLLRGNGLVKSEGGHSFRNLRAWLEEVCRVLGLSQTRKSSSRCPQLWIDEAWPPSRLTPRSKRSAPIWILPATEQNALVVQMSLLKEYRPQEIKALMGFEVGQLVLRRLPGVIPQELREPLTYGIFAARAYDALCRVTEPNQALAGAPPWIRRMLTGRARSWKRPYSHTGTTAEFEALGVILRRLVPGPLLPPIFAGLAVNSNEIAEALEHRKPPKWQLRGSPAPQPLRDLAGNALVLALIRLFSGSRGRSYVLTLDRAAALAAGDATAAASALLRVHRLLPPQQTDLRRTLGSVADMAHERIWAYRQEALFQNPREPPPAVRVAELLSWSQTDQAKRLIALAEMRRKHIETSSWKTWAPGRPWPWGSFSSAFWKPWMGYWALSILWLPFALTSIDAVRWASWVTLCLTVFGLLLPLLQFIGAPTLPFMSISTLWTSLLLYSLIAGSIWWNHLLGGARRWAVLSGQLAAQLVDQADAATGIAFLTRDWAEMARRSLAALDQELCGSWRTSLHELASKLADLRQELEDSTPLSNGNGVQKTLKDGDHSDEAEDDQGGHRQLALWLSLVEILRLLNTGIHT
eukprot:s2888_g7.t1